MKAVTYWLIFTQIIILSTLVRFWSLSAVPYTSDKILLLRFFSAFSGVASTGIIVMVAKKYHFSTKVSLLSGYFFTLLPHAVFEGRINSWVTQYTLFLLLSLYIYNKNLLSRILALSMCSVSTIYYLAHLSYLANIQSYYLTNYVNWTRNFFDLISFRKLFFTNDLYLDFSINSTGIMLPTLIPVFFVGIFVSFLKRKLFFFYISLLILLLASINPDYPFPSSRVIGLLAPALSLLLALGMDHLHSHVLSQQRKSTGKLYSILWGVYLLIITHGLFFFFHDFHYHYIFQMIEKNIYLQNLL